MLIRTFSARRNISGYLLTNRRVLNYSSKTLINFSLVSEFGLARNIQSKRSCLIYVNETQNSCWAAPMGKYLNNDV